MGYDNWLVSYAIDNGITVVDVSKTVQAVHQTGWDGNYASSDAPDANLNLEIAGMSVFLFFTTLV